MPEVRTSGLGRAARGIFWAAWATAAVIATIAHVRLWTSGPAETAKAELAFVGRELDRGAATEMQAIFPEGFFFTHVLHGLGALAANGDVAAGERALAAIDSPEGRAVFPRGASPPYGVFHAGWRAYLLAALAEIAPAHAGERDAAIDAIAAAFDAKPTPFLCAYEGQAWPVDSTVAIAAVARGDTSGRHRATIARWILGAKARADSATGLLPHRADPETGAALEGPRASSSTLIVRFLLDADPAWARAMYEAFRRTFVDTVLGVPGIREHPIGSARGGDVDSGPLIFGISMSATVVGLGAARAHGDGALAAPLHQVMEAFGFAFEVDGERRYGLGILPVGDAFIAWSHATPMAISPDPPLPDVVSGAWRLPFLAATIAVLGAPIAIRVWRRRRRAAREIRENRR